MTIHFLCPEGHPLTARLEQAGAEAKCPSCGILLIVPTPHGVAHDPDEASAAGEHRQPAPVDHSEAGETQHQASLSEGVFHFYCPNGHKLNGPASLQGKPGQCPQCGSKFVIPTVETQDAPPPVPEQPADFEDTEEILMGIIVEDEDADDQGTDDVPHVANIMAGADSGQLTGWESELSWQNIFEWLWQQGGQRGSIELQLSEGERVRPNAYATDLSQTDFAVFATTDTTGGHSLMAVRWEDVKRITLRNVIDLPEEFR